MDKIKILRDFLTSNFHNIQYDGSGGIGVEFPNFEIFPRDFLRFARIELNSITSHDINNSIHIINCVSHLKRALDCQFDLFLYQINLFNFSKSNNLRFNHKLDFLRNSGIIESRSMSRLNQLRNRMEHEYKVPIIQDLESYYDLVSASISVIESATANITGHNKLWLVSTDNSFDSLTFKYNFEETPNISINITFSDATEEINIKVTPNERDVFAYYLRAFLLMASLDFRRENFILEELQFNFN
ncbi:hypothetical protein ACQKII_14130 [Lysinibacillus sp. NPDC048646]|uniref:hypothetical protein n=1 Tax=Lysinibacillus sp. NPDC048646 TaxID=3390574 RepID=UPI003D0029CE